MRNIILKLLLLFLLLNHYSNINAKTIRIVFNEDKATLSQYDFSVSINDTLKFAIDGQVSDSNYFRFKTAPWMANTIDGYLNVGKTPLIYIPKLQGKYQFEILSVKSRKVISGTFYVLSENKKVHIEVVDGYELFDINNVEAFVGDTIVWLPSFSAPIKPHTITSAEIPQGANSFNYNFRSPSDTLFKYVVKIPGLYNYFCGFHRPDMRGSINVLDHITSTNLNPSSNRNLSTLVYPNPFVDFVKLEFKNSIKSVKIFDNLGRLVRNISVNDREFLIIETKDLEKGLYFIKVEEDNFEGVYKLLKE